MSLTRYGSRLLANDSTILGVSFLRTSCLLSFRTTPRPWRCDESSGWPFHRSAAGDLRFSQNYHNLPGIWAYVGLTSISRGYLFFGSFPVVCGRKNRWFKRVAPLMKD